MWRRRENPENSAAVAIEALRLPLCRTLVLPISGPWTGATRLRGR